MIMGKFWTNWFKNKIVSRETFKYKVYDSIDKMPLYNFIQCIENENYTYMIVGDIDNLNNNNVNIEKEKPFLINAFDNIIIQYYTRFGLPENLQQIMLIKKNILLFTNRMYINNDLSLQNQIKIEQLKLNELVKSPTKQIKFDEIIAAMEIHFKMTFDIFNTPVAKFYSYLAIYKKQNK